MLNFESVSEKMVEPLMKLKSQRETGSGRSEINIWKLRRQ